LDTGAFERIDTLDENQKTRFFGGKTKAALYDAGLLNKEDYFKPLKDIDLNGIMIPDTKTMNHAVIGEYKTANPPDSNFPCGRLTKGGHTIWAMAEMDKRGLKYNITRIAANGVIFGDVPNHTDKRKRLPETQIWFPKGWTEHDVRTAGIISANKGCNTQKYKRAKIAEYKGVKVITWSPDGVRIGTIAPFEEQES
jgi:hypothetical protein